MGWERLRNGKLLAAAAAAGFEAFITIDKNLKNQQNLSALPIAVLVVMAKSNRLADVLPFAPAIEAVLMNLKPRTLAEVTLRP
jgi:hypothetical protein